MNYSKHNFDTNPQLDFWFLKNFQEEEKVESPDIAIAAAAGLSDQEPGESYWKALCQEREKALNDTIEVRKFL